MGLRDIVSNQLKEQTKREKAAGRCHQQSDGKQLFSEGAGSSVSVYFFFPHHEMPLLQYFKWTPRLLIQRSSESLDHSC